MIDKTSEKGVEGERREHEMVKTIDVQKTSENS